MTGLATKRADPTVVQDITVALGREALVCLVLAFCPHMPLLVLLTCRLCFLIRPRVQNLRYIASESAQKPWRGHWVALAVGGSAEHHPSVCF